jgi:hypothetical protein
LRPPMQTGMQAPAGYGTPVPTGNISFDAA